MNGPTFNAHGDPERGGTGDSGPAPHRRRLNIPDAAEDIISGLMTAMSNRALYSASHHAVQTSAKKVIQRMTGAMMDRAVHFALIDDTLLFNQHRIQQTSLHANNFIKKLRRNGVEKPVIRSDVTTGEPAGLVAALASPFGNPRSFQNIIFGTLEVMLKGDTNYGIDTAMDRNVGQVRDIYRGLSRFGTLDVVGLEEVVASFISILDQEANVLRVISPVKPYSEYTFTHTTNVTLVSIFQIEALGLRGNILHEIALAGLLHDVGQQFVPKEILEKESKLEPHEWENMKQHKGLWGAIPVQSSKQSKTGHYLGL